MSRRRQKGFTLPEIMIALLVFAAIASASVYALRLGVDSRDQLAAADERLKAFQIARTLIKEDLAQVTARNVRDEFGQQLPAAFRGNIVQFGGKIEDDETLLLAFVRNGWRNPNADAPRSSLQYVEYILKDGALIRRSRVFLDEASQSDVMERVLFAELEDASASFLLGENRGELEWADIWPAAGAADKPPSAVSLMLTWPDQISVEQRFWIGELGGAS